MHTECPPWAVSAVGSEDKVLSKWRYSSCPLGLRIYWGDRDFQNISQTLIKWQLWTTIVKEGFGGGVQLQGETQAGDVELGFLNE